MSRRKPYVRQVPKTWWLKNVFYSKYMIREGSSVFVAGYALILLAGLWSLVLGPEAWAGWMAAMASPLAVVFNLAALALTVVHMVTWYKLVPVVLPKQLGKYTLDGNKIIGGHYAATGLLSLVFLVLAFGG